MLSTDKKILGEMTACVNLAEEDLSSKEALITIFMAVDWFIFLTGVLYLEAMGEGPGGGRCSKRRRWARKTKKTWR